MPRSYGQRPGRYNAALDPRIENQQRLRAYDMATAEDQRGQMSAERLDFQRQKEAFEEAYKTGEAERKAGEFSQRLEISDRRAGVLEQRMQLQNEIAQNNDLLKQQAALAKDKATLSRQNAAKDFYSGIGKLDPQSHDFQTGFSDLMSKVQSNLVDSEGKLPEDVNKVADHLWQQHNTWAAMNLKAKPDPVQAFQDSLAASSPVYGVADENGKNFNATQAGKDAQTHVQTTYIPPGSSKAVTQVFPRAVFDAAVAASQARSAPQATTPSASTDQPAATQPATTAAAAHPMEGQRVLQKSSGSYGTITNGQFVPEDAPSDSTQD